MICVVIVSDLVGSLIHSLPIRIRTHAATEFAEFRHSWKAQARNLGEIMEILEQRMKISCENEIWEIRLANGEPVGRVLGIMV